MMSIVTSTQPNTFEYKIWSSMLSALKTEADDLTDLLLTRSQH